MTLVRRLLLAFAALVLLAAIALTGTVLWLRPQLPELDKVTDYQPRQPLQVYTRDGVEIAQFGTERRLFTPIWQIPRRMQDALLAVEDARFREHAGIDPIGVARAALATLSGGMPQGASTITQQVARTFFLSSRRTAERKLKEALLALRIEEQLTKDQILELYMNQIYLGQRSYGFAAAAQTYFGKTLADLTVAETAMLAGLPQNPAFANPVTNPERARRRQLLVLRRMLTMRVIDDAEYAAALTEKLNLRSPLQVSLHAEHVAEMARLAVVERLGEGAYSQGIRVYTSLLSKDQRAARDAVRRGVLAFEQRQRWRGPEDQETLPDDVRDVTQAATQLLKDHRDDEDLRVGLVTQSSPQSTDVVLANGETVQLGSEQMRWGVTKPAAVTLKRGDVIRVARRTDGRWSIGQWPEVQSAFVSLEPATGRIRALVGGFDFSAQPFNHATQAWRQPGSSVKPFLYSAALEHGVMPATIVDDEPLPEPSNAAPGSKPWQPQNSDGKFDGPMTLREALARSKNLVSIRVLQQVGVQPARDWLTRFGLDADKQPSNLTLALGSGSTTPLQLASAYGVLANGGYRVAPRLIERIEDAQGKILYEAEEPMPPGELERVIPARNAFVTRSLLQSVTSHGTAALAQLRLKRPDIYGKTGTTNEAVDAWFAGFQPSVAAVAWMGYDEPKSLGQRESGGGLALPIWIDALQPVLRDILVSPEVAPDGVQQVDGDWRYDEWADGGYVTLVLAVAPTSER